MKAGSDFHLRLPKEIASRLTLLATERGVSRNLVVQSALEEFLHVGAAEKDRGMTLEDLRKDIYEIKRRLVALREDVEIVGELLSFYIYHWIGYAPRLEQDERLSLAAEAKERHHRFLNLFSKKLATGELSLATVFSAAGGERALQTENDEGRGESTNDVSDEGARS